MKDAEVGRERTNTVYVSSLNPTSESALLTSAFCKSGPEGLKDIFS